MACRGMVVGKFDGTFCLSRHLVVVVCDLSHPLSIELVYVERPCIYI